MPCAVMPLGVATGRSAASAASPTFDEVPLALQEPQDRRTFVAEVRGFGHSGAHAVLAAGAVTVRVRVIRHAPFVSRECTFGP